MSGVMAWTFPFFTGLRARMETRLVGPTWSCSRHARVGPPSHRNPKTNLHRQVAPSCRWPSRERSWRLPVALSRLVSDGAGLLGGGLSQE
jgi:hypothetical protein